MIPKIRSAILSDVSDVLRLWRDAEAEPSHTDDPEGLMRLIAFDSGALIVAEDGDRLVGTVIAAWDGWRGSIYRLVVAPSHRRRGVGRELLRRGERRVAGLGARRIQAIVVSTEVQATSFWDSSGWDRQFERLRFVKG
jgi:ribosomal protein S18 acetylase RimI-like enzyme